MFRYMVVQKANKHYIEVLDVLKDSPMHMMEIIEECDSPIGEIASAVHGAVNLGLTKNYTEIRTVDGGKKRVIMYSILEKGEQVLANPDELTNLLQ